MTEWFDRFIQAKNWWYGIEDHALGSIPVNLVPTGWSIQQALLVPLAIFMVLVWLRARATPIRLTTKSPPSRDLERPALEVHRPAVSNPGIITRQINRHKYAEPFQAGNITVETEWQHLGSVSTTGGMKSTVMALFAEQFPPSLVVSGGISRPVEDVILSQGGYVWEPHKGPGLDIFRGTPDRTAQALEHLFPKAAGDVGVYRGHFRRIARRYFQDCDLYGTTRNMDGLIKAIKLADGGRQLESMKEGWLMRLEDLGEALGDALGTDIDLIEAIRHKVPIMLALNAFTDPSMRPLFGALAITSAMQVVQEVRNFSVVLDELGLLDSSLVGEGLRTFRQAKVKAFAASQISDDFDPAMKGLIKIWFLGQMAGSDKKSRTWASDTTFNQVPADNFGGHDLKRGEFYVVTDDRVLRARVPVHKPRKRLPQLALPKAHRSEMTLDLGSGLNGPATRKFVDHTVSTHAVTDKADSNGQKSHENVTTTGPQILIDQDQHQDPNAPPRPAWTLMPGSDIDQLGRIWRRFIFPYGPDGCYESTYRLVQSGRPSCAYKTSEWVVYNLTLALHDYWVRSQAGESLPILDEWLADVKRRTKAKKDGGEDLTVNHLCKVKGFYNPDDPHADRKCGNPAHLEWMTRADNIGFEHESKYVGQVVMTMPQTKVGPVPAGTDD